MTAHITVNAAAQGLYIVRVDGQLAGRIVNSQGKGVWRFRREDRKDDADYDGRNVSNVLHDDAGLRRAIAEELA